MNRDTLVRAIAILEAEGLLRACPGRGGRGNYVKRNGAPASSAKATSWRTASAGSAAAA